MSIASSRDYSSISPHLVPTLWSHSLVTQALYPALWNGGLKIPMTPGRILFMQVGHCRVDRIQPATSHVTDYLVLS